MTTIYYGNPETRQVKVTSRGRSSPLSDNTYVWGIEGRGAHDLAAALIHHAMPEFDASPETIERFVAREVSRWQSNHPFAISKETIEIAVRQIEREAKSPLRDTASR